MNSVMIVLPILTVLMFDLGLNLVPGDFLRIIQRPKAMMVGLFGQLILLPVIAFALAGFFKLEPFFFIGLVLIACCPGGSSSNVFSMLAKGDVALSVSLTAFSSILTLFSVPVIMEFATEMVGEETGVKLPVMNLLMQNIVTMLVPIILGITVRKLFSNTAVKIDKVLSKCAFPALMLLAAIFFIQHRHTIADNIAILGLCTFMLIMISILCAYLMSRVTGLKEKVRRTIVIEVGMQNAAQAIAVASSPFVFNNGVIAIPAIVYALLMNLVLLTYVGIIKYSTNKH